MHDGIELAVAPAQTTGQWGPLKRSLTNSEAERDHLEREAPIWTLHSSVSVVSSQPLVLTLKTPVVVSMVVVIKSCVKNKK